MTTKPMELVKYNAPDAPVVTPEQVELIKRTVAKDATADELKLYFYDCQRQGVHPLDKLIHFTKRSGKYTPITSIDFMRTRAADSGEYAGCDDVQFDTLPDAKWPESATVTVYRLVQGQRCAFTATARWTEYLPEQAFMWKKMPYTMLGKCAEALALRKAFPRQLAGLYAAEEMDQSKRKQDAESQTWETQEDKQQIVSRKLKELEPPDEPATELDEIKRWKTVIGACKTVADFNAMIPRVKDKPNVVKMALMTASLDAGLKFDREIGLFCAASGAQETSPGRAESPSGAPEQPKQAEVPPKAEKPAVAPARGVETVSHAMPKPGIDDRAHDVIAGDIESGLEAPKLEVYKVHVGDVELRNRAKRGQFLLLTCMVPAISETEAVPLICWHKNSMFPHLLKAMGLDCEFGLVSEDVKGEVFWNIESIEKIGKQLFDGKQPITQPSGEQLFV